MPTIKTIKPGGGGDYTTLQAWWDGFAKSQATADQWAECYGGGDLGPWVPGDFTTATADSTHFVKVYAAASDRHAGVYDSSKADIKSLDGSSQMCINIACNAATASYMQIVGLQFSGANAGSSGAVQMIAAASVFTLDGTLTPYNFYGGYPAHTVAPTASGAVMNLLNNLVYDVGSSASANPNGFYLADPSNIGIVWNILNNTIQCLHTSGTHGVGFFWRYYGGNVNFQNNVIWGPGGSSNCISFFGGSPTITAWNDNATTDSTATLYGGTGNQTSISTSGCFTSSSDLHLATSSPLIGAGANLTGTNSYDAAGTAWATPYDIGALVKSKTATTTTDSPSPNPVVFDSLISNVAAVTGTGATGTVTFYDNGTSIEAATLSSGTATGVGYYAPSAGTHTLTAVYSGDSTFAGSTSSAVYLTVNKANPFNVVSGAGGTVAYGSSVSMTATVGMGSPTWYATGTVVFMDRGNTLGTATLNGVGVATFSSTALAVGTATITAVYSGDSNLNGITSSNSVNEVVTPLASTTSLASIVGTTPQTVGDNAPFPFTITITGSGGGPTPGGTVNFTQDGTTIGSAALTAGVATYNYGYPGIAVSTHSIVAVYPGDSHYSSSNSGTFVVTTLHQPEMELILSLPIAALGQTVDIYAALTAWGGATGVVTFKDGGVSIGNATLSGGVCYITTSSLTLGSHTITATYPGDSNDMPCTAGAVIQTIKYGTAESLVMSAASVTYGTSVTLTATVTSGGTPTGSVVFVDEPGGATLGSGTSIAPGVWTMATSTTLGVGTHSITANYSGDASNLAVSVAGVLVIGLVTSSTVLTESAPTANFGTAITFTATVSGTSPTGTVVFKEGASTLGTGTLSGGVATFADSMLEAATTHTIIAVYSGDLINSTSNSNTILATINKLSPTVAGSSSPDPSLPTQAVTLSASVTGSGLTPTGTIAFVDGGGTGATLGVATLGGGTCSVVLAGAVLAPGFHLIQAAYSGDGLYSSGSAGIGQAVSLGATTTTLGSSSNPSASGSAVTFSASVSPVIGSGTPSGSVAFVDESAGTTIGSSTLIAGAASVATSALAIGVHGIVAVYSGDANYATSSSPTLGQLVVTDPSTTGLTVSPSSLFYGQDFTFSVSVTVTGGPATGTVTFFDSGISIALGTLAAGVVSVVSSALGTGSHSFTAVYSGDATFATSTSTPAAGFVINDQFPRIYVDAEVPSFGELALAPVTSGTGTTISQATGMAAFPDRGGTGFVFTLTAGTGTSYIPFDLGAGYPNCCVRVLIGHPSFSAGTITIVQAKTSGGSETFHVTLSSTGAIQFVSGSSTISGQLTSGLGWSAVEVRIDAFGTAAHLWIDGQLIGSVTGLSLLSETFKIGVVDRTSSTAVGTIYLDEVIIQDVAIGLVCVKPAGSMPAAADPTRWLVLYNPSSSDSVAWVESYRAGRTVPYANLCGVAGGSESISSATYSSLLAVVSGFIANNHADGHLVGIVVGYDVPGVVVLSGTSYCVASLLATLGSTPAVTNPLYNSGVQDVGNLPSRATLSRAGGAANYLVGEITGPDLAIAEALTTRAQGLILARGDGRTISTLRPGTDKAAFNSGSGAWPSLAAWLGTVPQQQLRLQIGTAGGSGNSIELGTAASPAFALGAQKAAVYGSVASNGAGTVWSGSEAVAAALAYGTGDGAYAVAFGHVGAPMSDLLDPAPFFAALRGQWTLAEAWAIAAPKVGATLRVIGDPLAILPMPLQGYEVYDRPLPTASHSLVGVVPSGLATFTVTGLPANSTHNFEVRSVNRCGVQDGEPTRLVAVQFDGSDQMILPGPNSPTGLNLKQLAAGYILATWKYVSNSQAAPLYAFKVFVATGSAAFNFSSPAATLTVGNAQAFQYQATLGPYADMTLVRVIVRAVSQAGGSDQNQNQVAIQADAATPATPISFEVQ